MSHGSNHVFGFICSQAGLLKKNVQDHEPYIPYMRKFAWTFSLSISAVVAFSVIGDIIKCVLSKNFRIYMLQTHCV